MVPQGGRGFAASLIYQTGDGRFKKTFYFFSKKPHSPSIPSSFGMLML